MVNFSFNLLCVPTHTRISFSQYFYCYQYFLHDRVNKFTDELTILVQLLYYKQTIVPLIVFVKTDVNIMAILDKM